VDAGADKDAQLALARRQANAAVALAAVGRWEKVWTLLRHSPDPSRRSYLIDRLGPGGAEVRTVSERLGSEPDVSVRRALVLVLGEFDRDRLPPAEREALVPPLIGLYRDDPDPGLHGAAGWLLRQWGQEAKVREIDRELATGKVEGSRQWYVNSQEQTLVLVPPGEFEMEEGRERFRVRIERRFALAAREVTVAEFLRFRKDHIYAEKFALTEDCPVNGVSWYDAAAYSNWLSEREGLAADQWCYEPSQEPARFGASTVGLLGSPLGQGPFLAASALIPGRADEYSSGMKIKANYLSLTGYRLPTEAEWEYACRARSVTTWSLGEAEDLVGKYAWYAANASSHLHPPGTLRPNELGLFDLHGNAQEWCQDRYGSLRQKEAKKGRISKEDLEDIVDSESSYMLRGGSFIMGPGSVSSAGRAFSGPAVRRNDWGFRPARTLR
jgi:formylglycine-generating enzyme required for sulfatase activity